MANTNYDPLAAFNRSYGRQIENRLRQGGSHVIPYVPILWRVTVDYTDASTAGTTKALNLNTLAGTGKEFPANVYIRGVYAYVHTTADGGATSETTIQIGDTANANGLVTAHSIHEDATGAAGFQVLPYGSEMTDQSRFEAAYTPECLVTSTGANLDALTQGEWTIIFDLLPIEVPPTS